MSATRCRSVAGRPRPLGTRRMLDGVFAIDRMLRSGRTVDLQTLATQAECAPRTAQRYLAFLRDSLHAPVECVAGGGYRYSDPRFVVPATYLTEQETMALFLAGPLLSQYRDTPLGDRCREAVAKLTECVGGDARVGVLDIDDRVAVKAPVPAHPDVRVFDILLRAVTRDRRLRLLYWAAHRDEEGERVVDPHALYCVDGVWYLAAWCHERQDWRTFMLARVRHATETGQTFERRPGFDARAYLRHSFGVFRDAGDGGLQVRDVVIRFDRDVVRFVREKRWHSSETRTDLADGGLELRMHVTGLAEVEEWVLGWGEHAEVLEPADLRARVIARLEAALDRYRGGSGATTHPDVGPD